MLTYLVVVVGRIVQGVTAVVVESRVIQRW